MGAGKEAPAPVISWAEATPVAANKVPAATARAIRWKDIVMESLFEKQVYENSDRLNFKNLL
jgi:hypothetical protein